MLAVFHKMGETAAARHRGSKPAREWCFNVSTSGGLQPSEDQAFAPTASPERSKRTCVANQALDIAREATCELTRVSRFGPRPANR